MPELKAEKLLWIGIMETIPKFIYGTAWKEEKTEDLTFKALSLGFRAIDTANQRKHYYEEGVGLGIQKFLKLSDSLSREDIFLQSKFTYARGQDHRRPYNDLDTYTQQVFDSFTNTLEHLATDYLDSFVLHGPFNPNSIGSEDMETWSAMEDLVNKGKVKNLGVSNISPEQLVTLISKVKIKPTFVQNRCFAKFGWDKEVREICKNEGIFYQGFSLLTANLKEITTPLFLQMAEKYNKTLPQIVFRFAYQLGIICLTGTTNTQHMQDDLEIFGFEMDPSEVFQLELDAF